MNKASLAIYENVASSLEDINAWNDVNQVKSITEDELVCLNEISCIEVVWQGTQGDRSKFEPLFTDFHNAIASLIKEYPVTPVLFHSQFKLSPKSRLKSHNGLVHKSIEDKHYIEKEIEIDGQSIFASTIKLNGETFDQIIALFDDNSTAFIVFPYSVNNFFNADFIEKVVTRYMNHNGMSTIQFYKLIATLSDYGHIVRISGDGGDDYISLQIFTANKHRDEIGDLIRKSEIA